MENKYPMPELEINKEIDEMSIEEIENRVDKVEKNMREVKDNLPVCAIILTNFGDVDGVVMSPLEETVALKDKEYVSILSQEYLNLRNELTALHSRLTWLRSEEDEEDDDGGYGDGEYDDDYEDEIKLPSIAQKPKLTTEQAVEKLKALAKLKASLPEKEDKKKDLLEDLRNKLIKPEQKSNAKCNCNAPMRVIDVGFAKIEVCSVCGK